MGCIFRTIKHGHQTALEFLNCCPFTTELNILILVFKVIQNGSTEYHVKTRGLFRSRIDRQAYPVQLLTKVDSRLSRFALCLMLSL